MESTTMLINHELESLLAQRVPVGSCFEHYKGMRYEILSIGRHSESEDLHVVYRALYADPVFGKNAIWIRPLAMFLETIELDGEIIPCFKRIS